MNSELTLFPARPHVGDGPTQVTVKVSQALDGLTTGVLKVRKPDGTVIEPILMIPQWDTDPGILLANTPDGLFDQVGHYAFQVYLAYGEVHKVHGTLHKVYVHPALPCPV